MDSDYEQNVYSAPDFEYIELDQEEVASLGCWQCSSGGCLNC